MLDHEFVLFILERWHTRKQNPIKKSFAPQGMYELPTAMHMRFWFYLNFLPILEEMVLYLAFLSGVMLLVWCVIRILSYQTNESPEEGLEREIKIRRKRAQKDECINQKGKETDAYSSLLILGDANLTTV